MTVDSEAIFALAAHSRSDARALEALHGSMAAALARRARARLLLPRPRHAAGRSGSAQGRAGVFFASTKHALELVERYCGLKLRKRELNEGTLVALATATSSRASASARERVRRGDPLPAVRAPQEREVCLTRLAAIAAAA